MPLFLHSILPTSLSGRGSFSPRHHQFQTLLGTEGLWGLDLAGSEPRVAAEPLDPDFSRGENSLRRQCSLGFEVLTGK